MIIEIGKTTVQIQAREVAINAAQIAHLNAYAGRVGIVVAVADYFAIADPLQVHPHQTRVLTVKFPDGEYVIFGEWQVETVTEVQS